MKMARQISTAAALLVCLLACPFCRAQANNQTMPSQSYKEKAPAMHAKGTFDVKLAPQNSPELPQGAIARMSIDKTFHGDLDATSKGEMLASGSGAKGGSGGYVALEQVSGTLGGRKGTFVLQHNATMTKGVPNLAIIVVPGSGTDQLTGLTGSMNIIITEGKHSYDMEYKLPVGTDGH